MHDLWHIKTENDFQYKCKTDKDSSRRGYDVSMDGMVYTDIKARKNAEVKYIYDASLTRPEGINQMYVEIEDMDTLSEFSSEGNGMRE